MSVVRVRIRENYGVAAFIPASKARKKHLWKAE
jgi:hypothetical protein